MSIYEQYEIVVGLEVHAQLNTRTKIFAPDPLTFGATPNTQVSFITLGHPGTLPVLNKAVIEKAVRVGIATHCSIQKNNQFSRKNYFYPDLPKGYQISQFDTPICYNGYMTVKVGDANRTIRINRIHLEEDAGKSIHDQNPRFSQIDLNRASTPLIEIVTEPDLRSSEEAYQYLIEIRKLVQFLDVCDGNMEEGSLRCDANVSVRRKGVTTLGQRAEIKNMNSIRAVKKAIDYEAKRQIDILENGGTIMQETRGYDMEKGTTFSQRSKEMAHDYRYFPEPDLPLVVLDKTAVEQIRAAMPPLPQQLAAKYTQQLGLSEYDAQLLTESREMVAYFETLISQTNHYKSAANWLNTTIKAYLNDNNISIGQFPIAPAKIAQVIELIQQQKVSHTAAVQFLFPALLQQPETESVAQLVEQLQIVTHQDSSLMDSLIAQVLDKYPDKVKDYLYNGKKNLLGMFLGEIMREAKGKIDPKNLNQRLTEQLLARKK